MDSAQSNEDEPLPESEQVLALCVFVHSAELPPPCLTLKGLVIYPDLVWSGNISTSPLCWTESNTQPPPLKPLWLLLQMCGVKPVNGVYLKP